LIDSWLASIDGVAAAVLGRALVSKLFLHFLVLTVLGWSPAAAHAATIQWGPATGISGDPDVRTAGSLVAAFNVAGASTTVNGVTFATFGVGAQTNTVGDFTLSVAALTVGAASRGSAQAPFASLTPAYRALLDNAASTLGEVMTLTMAGLTPGQGYELQLWVNDSRDHDPPGFTFEVDVASGNSVYLDPNTSIVEGGVGQYVAGTFLADSATQQVTFSNSEVGGSLNGFQLRAVTLARPRAVPAISPAGVGAACVLLLLGGFLGIRRTAGGEQARLD